MDTRDTSRRTTNDVDLLLDNARLRDELEPYRDESIDDASVSHMSLETENEYLASILAWERAPALPIASWFTPVLELPSPDAIDDQTLSALLQDTIKRLFEVRVVLCFTDHLSDRELYTTIYRDILPCCEKKVELPGKYLEWRCLADNDTWLRYYASPVERRRYQEEYGVQLPPSEPPRFKRLLPRPNSDESAQG